MPDSLLKDFCAYISDHADEGGHAITANEGAAVALVTGHYLATGELGLVYMQNAGQGNAVNPLVSLADPEVYGIPMLLMIGWRGEPGQSDEPQHIKQGKITLPLLEVLGIPHQVLPTTNDDAVACLETAVETALRGSTPYGVVVREGSFERHRPQEEAKNPYTLSREEALQLVVDQLGPREAIVATTGMTSRELFEYRVASGQEPGRDFLTVGSMGHASQIALGIARARPDRQVYCLDGDGAVLMHMGALATIGSLGPKNFKHIILNNGAHDSVGGQPTAGFDIDLPAIAAACGYSSTARAESANEARSKLAELRSAEGPALLEIRTRRGARPDLGRPTTSPTQLKQTFMRLLQS